ncbi:hypothetical protein DFQ26_003001 [Actinomortierella ambigua]|nr:hypothetical protein DFQ26_003001 [Actinomortierella ambigua]
METMPAIAIILPPRTRLHELKQSAHFPFDEVQHSIKTWINMASLLVKQGLMAESQRDDENAYISFIRACMIITKIIPHQACYASMMNDIACIDLRQKILSIVTRLGHLERRLLDKFEKDNQFQKQQQQQQQQMLQPAAPTEQFLRVASPEPPAIEARTSSLGAATTSRPSSTEPHLSPSMNSERIMSSSRQHPPSPPSSDSDFASKGEGDDDDDEDDDDVDNDDEVEEALESCYTTSAFAYTKSDSLQTRGEKNKKEKKEKRSDGTRQAVPGDGTTEEAEEEAEEQDTNMLKVDVEQNSMPRRREHPEILLLDEDDPILEYGAKDQICQARVQVDVIEDGEIVISERSSSNSNSTTNEGAFHSSSHHHNLFGEDEDQVPHQQEDEDEDEDADIAEEETELTFDLTTGVREGITHRDHKEKNQKDKEDDNDYPQTRARAPSHEEAFELNLDPASYAVRRRQAIQQQRQQQQQLEANIHTVTKTTITATTPAQRPRFVTAPLPFPAGNLLDEKERAAATTVQPRPRQSLTIYRTPLNERDDRSAFHQSVPGLEDNAKRTNHHHHHHQCQQQQQQQQLQPYPHVRRCSSSDALSRSATVGSHFPGKHLPEPLSSQQYQQQQQQQQANTRSKRISPPPRSPHRISVQILSSFPVSAPLPTPPPTHSPTFSQMLKQQQEQQQQSKMMRTESIVSTVHDLDPSQQHHHHHHHHHHLSTPPLGRPSLSPSSPRQSMDQMSVQGSSHDGLLSSPPPPMQYPSNKASSGSLPLNLHHLHRRVPTTTKTTSPSAHLGHVHAGSMSSNHSGSASPASAYSSPVSSPMLVQSRQMSGGGGGGASHLGFSSTNTTIPSSLPSPKLSNVAKMAAMAGTTSTMTTVSSCSEGSTVSNHMAMSSISSSTTVVTALSTVTLVSSQPSTPVFPPLSSSSSSPSFNKLASIPCSPALSPVPGANAAGGTTTTPSTGNNTISSTITTPTLHSFRKPGLLRKIRSRPKMGDSNSSNNPIFEMVDTATSAAANAPPPMALLMHVNPNASLRG